MKTLMLNPSKVERKWKLVDATDKPLGRVATQIARILMGKNKAICSPSVDAGDFVVVINADKVALTGNKAQQKQYFYHTGHIGGETWVTFEQAMIKDPTWPLWNAVRGMVPHTTLGRAMISKLKIYAGAEHPHAAQNPEPVKL